MAGFVNTSTRPLGVPGVFLVPLYSLLDLLNRPAGGEAYCGGVLFRDLQHQPLHHFRGNRAIDRPLSHWSDPHRAVSSHSGRCFGAARWPFIGHQIADFGSRVLLASIDPRGGELLWIPGGLRLRDELPHGSAACSPI